MHKMILFKHYSFTAIWLNSIWNVINTQYHALNILSININRQNMHKMLQYRRRCIMYINTGYLNHSHKDFKDKSRPLIVGSCGTYRLSQHPKMPTYRPRGRLDYQIIHIIRSCSFPLWQSWKWDNHSSRTYSVISPKRASKIWILW